MNYIVNLLELSGLNILLALSVYATFKIGQFSLAQVGFWAIGANLAGMLTALWGVPLLPALAAGGIVCGVIGAALSYPCLRIRGIYLTLATVAFLELVRVFFHNFEFIVTRAGVPVGPAGAQGFRGIPLLATWVEILVAVIVFAGLFVWLERSRLGLSVQSIREDETAAACMGIPVVRLKVGMFVLGAFIAGVGGGLYATYTTFVTSENFGFHLALISIFFVTVGGSERVAGPILGAVVLTILPEALRFVGDLRMVVYGALVLVLMVAFPRGVIDEIWHRREARAAQTAPVVATTPAAATQDGARA